MAFGIDGSNQSKVINSVALEPSIKHATLVEELNERVTKTREIDDTKIVIKTESAANCKSKLGIEITRHENVAASSETKLQSQRNFVGGLMRTAVIEGIIGVDSVEPVTEIIV